MNAVCTVTWSSDGRWCSDGVLLSSFVRKKVANWGCTTSPSYKALPRMRPRNSNVCGTMAVRGFACTTGHMRRSLDTSADTHLCIAHARHAAVHCRLRVGVPAKSALGTQRSHVRRPDPCPSTSGTCNAQNIPSRGLRTRGSGGRCEDTLEAGGAGDDEP